MTNKDSFPAHKLLATEFRYRLVPNWEDGSKTLDFEKLISEFQQLRQLADEMADALGLYSQLDRVSHNPALYESEYKAALRGFRRKRRFALTKYNSIIKGI